MKASSIDSSHELLVISSRSYVDGYLELARASLGCSEQRKTGSSKEI
jgi:hypothetical protein